MKSYTTKYLIGDRYDAMGVYYRYDLLEWVGSSPIYVGSFGYLNPVYGKSGFGFILRDVNIQSDANITGAKLNVLSASGIGGGSNVKSRIRAEKTNAAEDFTTVAQYLGRDRTTEYTEWDFSNAWVYNTWYQSPDFSEVIQELVDEFGGLEHSDIVIFLDDHDDRSDHVINTYRQALMVIEYQFERINLEIAWQSDKPLFDSIPEQSSLTFELNDDDIFNDIRFMIPDYATLYDPELDLYIPYDYVYRRLDGVSERKYGRRTKYSKYHIIHRMYGSMITARDMEKHKEPVISAKATVQGIDPLIIHSMLRPKNRVSLSSSDLDMDFWVDGSKIRIDNKGIRAQYELNQVRGYSYHKIFQVDVDYIDGEAVLG